MTGVKVNGEFLVLDALEVTFELENTAFSDDLVFSGFSIPGEAPVCEINNRIFKSGYSQNIKEKVKQFPCEFFFRGTLVYYGTLNLLETSRTSYRWNISISGISAELLDKKLADLDYGADLELGDTTVEILASIDALADTLYPDSNICFPQTYNRDFYGEYGTQSTVNPDYKGYLNLFVPTTGQYFRPNIIQAPAQDNITAFSPWISLQFILRTIFRNAGWETAGTFITHPDMLQLMVYGGRSLDKTKEVGFVQAKSSPSVIQTLFPKDTWQVIDLQVELQDPENRFASSKYEVPFPHPGSGVNQIGFFEFNITWRAGFVSLGGAQIPTELYLGILFEGDDPATQTIILEHLPEALYVTTTENSTIESRWLPVSRAGQKFNFVMMYQQASGTDSPGTILINDFQVKAVSLSGLNLLNGTIHYPHHVPDISVRDFLVQVRNVFNLSFTPDLFKKAMVVNFFDPTFAKVPISLTEESLYEYNSTMGIKSRYLFNYKWGGNDGFENDNFKDPAEYIWGGEVGSEAELPAADIPNKVYYIRNANRYVFGVKDPTYNIIRWKFFSDRFSDFIVGTGETVEYVPELRPVFMGDAGTVDGPGSTVSAPRLQPYLLSKGNSPCFGLGTENPQPLKMAFWRGMQPNRLGQNYPFATSYTYRDDGTQAWGVSLRWDDPSNGLYSKFWANRVRSLQDSEMVEFDAVLTLSRIISFDITGKYSMQDVYYVIKMMRIKFTEFDFGPTEFETYRLL